MLLNPIKSAYYLTLASLAVGLTPIVAQAQATPQQTVSIQFAGMVGDQAFSCEESYMLGTTETMMMPTDFRLYVSEVALIDTDGNAVMVELEQDGQWQYENVALLDFEDGTGTCANGTAETRTEVVGTVPEGEYEGVRFTLGVPFDLNHADATLAASPLNLTAMWWNWQGGYKFLRADFENHTMTSEATQIETKGEGHHPSHHGSDSSETHGTEQNHTGQGHGDHSDGHSEHGESAIVPGIAVHIGSTGCQVPMGEQQPTACNNPNRAEVVMSNFDVAENVVITDLAALLADNDLTENDPDTPPGCMSSPEDSDCLGIMTNLGIPFAEEDSPEQTVFRMQ
ncbi:metallo-mystery pair system four-Cys motif protein [Oscillatoria sp. CS-180]|uniref:MbnP family copper-binding protein n=1 Tax=Oscillatoria sp. CS-180 TaxID=3021720 RepID=UPI00232E8E30|nr:MbnP family copper-binding protein [Oscillatoria sp. CS-180]MDB9527617.1 metallo-mystery pair system four-Cys motif protein [Oscillatoria sp. CS-180]